MVISLGVTNIGSHVFERCNKLKTIGLESGNQMYTTVDGVLYTKDMKRLVAGPGGLISVTIPGGVVDIGDHAFRYCRDLKAVEIPTSVKRIGKNAFWGTSLKSVVIPPSVEAIGDAAFCCCVKMTSVVLPEGVANIGGMAFYRCWRLESVTIPASVKDIGNGAFSGCKELDSVTMLGERPDVKGDVFDKCENLVAIHVPSRAKSWDTKKEWQGIPLVFDADTK